MAELRLSQRIRKILELLNCQYVEPNEEQRAKIKAYLEQASLIGAKIRAMSEKEIDVESLRVTEEKVDAEIKYMNSLSLKQIILKVEQLSVSKFYDKDDFVDYYNRDLYANVKDCQYSPYSYCVEYRGSVSLVEVIAGKLYPKGKVWRRGELCQFYEGYAEAFRKAKKLEASYSRTLKYMVKKGWIEQFSNPSNKKKKQFIITSKGKELLAILTKDRIVNTSAQVGADDGC